MYYLESAAKSDPGRKRQNNEDYIAFFEPADAQELQDSGCLYLVADGVGGEAKGERASQYAAQKVLFEYYRYPDLPPGERLQQSLRLAGREIHYYAEDNLQGRMATTMVAAVIREDMLVVANVGDSRAYLLRDGKIEQITRDHSLVGEMVRDGLITEDEALSSKAKNTLTRSLGGEEDVRVDIFPEIKLQPNDRILLCSDGLTRYALRADLRRLLSNGGSTLDDAQRLIDFANQNGGVDNVSVILIKIGEKLDPSQIAIRNQHGQSPMAVDWENMPTQAIFAVNRKSTFFRKYKKYWPHATISAVALIAFVIILSGLIRRIQSYQDEEATALNQLESIPLTTDTMEGISQEPPTPVVVTTLPSDDGNHTTETAIVDKPTVSLTQTTEISSTNIISTTDASDLVCRKQVFIGDNLTSILKTFGIDLDPGGVYYYFDCGGQAIEPDFCEYKQYPIGATLLPWDWIIIPDNKTDGITKEECEENNGQWYSHTP